ncbi:MAG: LysR family transcriptional regulator [Lactobacillus sp.]|uniref:LysR family transcriptional regulator n=1 Tax=Bombilactobacillus bombi TaxID=1303590 RepID=UPI0035E6AF9F|nr:LysR family transcriptional regulator [Lactobacillus sp.]
MDLNKLKYFIEVAENQNFTKVAQKNYVSQTSISQQIAHLETELQTKLFDRSTLPVQLTETGRITYNYAQKIMQQYESLQQDLKYINQKKRSIKIAYSEGFLDPIERDIIPIIKRIPQFEYELIKVGINSIQSTLLNHKSDVAICFSSDIDTQKIKLLDFAYGNFDIIVGPKNTLYDRQKISSQQLSQQKLIYIAEQYNSNLYKQMLNNAKKEDLQINISKTVKDIETALILVRMSQAALFIPEYNQVNQNFPELHRLQIVGTKHKYSLAIAWIKSNNDAENFIKQLSQHISKS